MNKPENHILVIFGASGDLTKRKLIPALYSLQIQDLLPEKFAIIGVSRTAMTHEDFRNAMLIGLQKFSGEKDKDPDMTDHFLKKIFYTSIDADDPSDYRKLSEVIAGLRTQLGIDKNVICYLSVPPSLYGVIPRNLALSGLNDQSDGWKRVIIEKPFGYNLQTAVRLNTGLEKDWQEDQLYRIDHYLGKETVQNLLVTRFTNGIFEPLWNRNYVDRIEITSAENIGVEKRGGYYEGSGALRDMVQNHLLQVAGLLAMEG
ncbi:MAG: glucose-6-phosphate dehydrogenase (NADP(+)), partial [Bacteroidetes bacterium]|nr:glucose-6-phosphate dehydrogenase (NADP(+)) [Bacteroidota bacterium]